MKPFQNILVLTLAVFICLNGVLAINDSESDSASDSDSDSDENGADNKIKGHTPAFPQPYGYPYPHPVYMPQSPPAPYVGYNPPPMPYYYGYAQPPQQAVPYQPGYGPYSHGGHYNQSAGGAQGSQYYPGVPGGSSTINHSLKVNKEYNEDGHHYKPDSSE